MSRADRTPPSEAEYAEYRTRFCNWGRWGADDELGTVNHVTEQVRRDAAALVREGRSISLARPLDTRTGPANPYPAHHFQARPGSGGMLDYVGMFIHGVVLTHIDALCHLPTENGRMWNDRPMGEDRMPATRNGTIEFLREGIVTRGVLYDVPRHRGADFVAPGRPVHGWELDDVAAAQGVQPRPGDAVLIRSGFDPFWRVQGHGPAFESVTGVHASCVEFLFEHDAALLVWDFQDAPTADQGIPNPSPRSPMALHVHHILLPYMGMPIIDNADLEELARCCAEVGRWEFQLVVAPLHIPGATGSPVNPIAVL
ncbi:MAG TPA: cyclase family protein [Acidimicrobiales bacterium]|nr:cyclase family protein [Acidimicrobiales bacterium]